MKTHTLTTDGSTDAFLLNSRRAAYTVKLAGTFGGATATLEVRANADDDWTAVPDGAFTEATVQTLEIGNVEARWTLSSAGTTSIKTAIISHFSF